MSRSRTRRKSNAPANPPEQPPRRRWRVLLGPGLLLLGLAAGFLGVYLWTVDRWLQAEFGRLSWQIPTRIYARPLTLKPGLPLNAEALTIELDAAAYRADGGGAGSYQRDGATFRIHTRGYRDLDGAQPPRALRLTLADGRIASLSDDAGRPLREARLDPARIGSFYGRTREERRLLRLEEVPPLLIAALQAVEDRDFKNHAGIDWTGIARALFANLRAGEVRQGGSTLTQQLVRNLYLSREQTWSRKLREAIYAILIEARFPKRRILEVYLNQVYLGQQGSQAVHGVGAAAQFWFGRELEQLGPAEIALLIGMIQGPSYYDPRRYPERAKQRRDLVLGQLVETGVLDAAQATRARAQPLGVSAHGGLAANRYPAFLDLVKEQLSRDYTEDSLGGAGLTILTTLSPSAQHFATRTVTEQLAALEKDRKLTLQAALVLTDTRSGAIEAVVGDRDPGEVGFNRALEAQRPVGSLLKPFVYLLALAQPGRYSLATPVEDAPITVRVSGSQQWRPDNIDKQSHGWVALIDALAQSYNQATVRIGMDIGVDRLSRLMQVLAGIAPPAHPSLLLGAVDLSPMQMARLYQFLAAGGQLQALHAVRGVLDGDGLPLHRYERPAPAPERGDTIAARLVTLALQEAAERGTARRLAGEGLAALRPAGKTGTSNDSRDSWFAGWTGSHLAVVWVGDDQNRPTGLHGATGAMRVWSGLFKRLPTAPLRIADDGLEWAWVARDQEVRTDAECAGARQLAFVEGYAPIEHRGCTLERLRDWFGWSDASRHAP